MTENTWVTLSKPAEAQSWLSRSNTIISLLLQAICHQKLAHRATCAEWPVYERVHCKWALRCDCCAALQSQCLPQAQIHL